MWREVSAVVAGSFFLVALFTYLPLIAPWLGPFSSVLIAAAFIYLPVITLWRRNEPLPSAGIRFSVAARPALAAALVLAIIFPLFSVGFFAYHSVLFGHAPCVRVAKMFSWSESLYRGSPASAAGGLVLEKTDSDELLLSNGGQQSRRVELKWAPPGMRVQRLGVARSRHGVVSQGTVTVRPGETIHFSQVEGPAEVSVSGAGELQEGASGNSDLPCSSSKSPWWPLSFLWVQVILVALPEELFYRGYLQTRLSRLFRTRLVVLGGDIGPAVILASAVFALGHLIAIPSAGRLAVFFPSILFGWLRSRTGSLPPGIAAHAISNVLLAVLQKLLC